MEKEIEVSTIDDPAKIAKLAGLRYVSDSMPGYTRKKAGKGFFYLNEKGERITDKETVNRIKKLVLPPAWTKVWICPNSNGHLLATGFDNLNRKQYRYHEGWNKIRNETKYYRMLEFGKYLPKIRERIEQDLSSRGLNKNKVLALVVSLMERTFIRIGNVSYERLYGSYGLSTFRDKHAKINGSTVLFRFKGKKGIYQEVKLKNKKLASLVKKCQDIPGYDLFQYYDEEGQRQAIDSGSVNDYLKEITGLDFTAKDFRTWGGTMNALIAFREIGSYSTATEAKKNIVKAIDKVCAVLGNTRTICKKYYIHPSLIEAYEDGCLMDYVKELDIIEEDENKTGLTCEEELLVKILNTLSIQNNRGTGKKQN
jgi:DNA topoisomerase I